MAAAAPSTSSDQTCFMWVIYNNTTFEDKTNEEIVDELIANRTFFSCLERSNRIFSSDKISPSLMHQPSIESSIDKTITFILGFSIPKAALETLLNANKELWTDADWNSFRSRITFISDKDLKHDMKSRLHLLDEPEPANPGPRQ